MKTMLKFRQNGFTIIEALIAFLLLGIGVAALLYLQGNLMVSSSLSKAQAEATELAKDRTEMLHNFIQKDQFISALNSAQNTEGPVPGKNATYSVSYKLESNAIHSVTNPPKPEETQLLLVKVSWTGSDGDSEEVSLETKLYFLSPIIASGIVTSDEVGDDFFPLISPFITGVEKKHDSTDGAWDSSRSGENTHKVMVVDENTDAISFEPVIVKINTYTNSGTGRSNVEVVVGDVVKLTSFGGIVHKIQGDIIVYGANSTLSELIKPNSKLLGLFASPPSYCLFSICENPPSDTEVCKKSNGAEYMSYICYVPGDCTYGDVDGRCPDPFKPPSGRNDLNGGWYGRVGNYNLELPQDKVCAANTDDVSWKTSSREYVTYRCKVALVDGKCDDDDGDASNGNGNIIGNEGINTPYKAQTFLIVNKQAVCSDEILDIPESNLVNDHIVRKLVGEKKLERDAGGNLIDDTWDQNVVLPENLCVETFVDVNGDTVHDPSCPTP